VLVESLNQLGQKLDADWLDIFVMQVGAGAVAAARAGPAALLRARAGRRSQLSLPRTGAALTRARRPPPPAGPARRAGAGAAGAAQAAAGAGRAGLQAAPRPAGRAAGARVRGAGQLQPRAAGGPGGQPGRRAVQAQRAVDVRPDGAHPGGGPRGAALRRLPAWALCLAAAHLAAAQPPLNAPPLLPQRRAQRASRPAPLQALSEEELLQLLGGMPGMQYVPSQEWLAAAVRRLDPAVAASCGMGSSPAGSASGLSGEQRRRLQDLAQQLQYRPAGGLASPAAPAAGAPRELAAAVAA
jgi:hypothetical protein